MPIAPVFHSVEVKGPAHSCLQTVHFADGRLVAKWQHPRPQPCR